MPQIGPTEFILILVIFFIFFGAGKLGDFGGALGRGIKEFKKGAGWDEPAKTDPAVNPPPAATDARPPASTDGQPPAQPR